MENRRRRYRSTYYENRRRVKLSMSNWFRFNIIQRRLHASNWCGKITSHCEKLTFFLSPRSESKNYFRWVKLTRPPEWGNIIPKLGISIADSECCYLIISIFIQSRVGISKLTFYNEKFSLIYRCFIFVPILFIFWDE